jgi:tetratricopeptide (TPR) repeat protein
MANSNDNPGDDQTPQAKLISITERLEQQQFDRLRKMAAKSHNRELESALEFATTQKDLKALDMDEVIASVLASDDPRAPDMYREVRCLRGWQSMLLEQVDAAHAEWDAVASEFPDFAQPLIFRAHWMVPNDPAGAIEWFDKAAKREPANRQIYWGKAECYRILGDIDRSIAHLRRALSLEPDNVDTMIKLGATLTSAGHAEEAIGLLDQAIARAPRYADFYLARATAHYSLLHYPQAIADYERVLQLDPTHLGAIFFRARCMSKIEGQLPRAMEIIKEFCAKCPDEPLAHLEHGSMLLAAMQVPEAIETLTHAIELKPDLAAAYGKRGAAHLRLFQIDACLADLQRSYELDPDDLEHAAIYQTVLRVTGRNEDALKVIDYLLIDNEDFYALYRDRAETLARMGQNEPALAAILRAHELEPGDASLVAGVASMYATLGQWATAIDYCDKTIALNPEDGATHSLRATCRTYLDYDDPRIAIDYARAVALKPQDFSIHVLRSRYLYEKCQFAEALSEAEAAIPLAPHIGESFALRARAKFHHWQEVVGEQSIDEPYDDVAADNVEREVIADLERALELDFVDDDIYSDLAGHLQELREDTRAMEYIDKGLARNPDDCGCLIWRASVRRRRGDVEGANADHARVQAMSDARQRAHDEQQANKQVD